MDNGIDEDCSGADLSNVLDLNDLTIGLYPNPTSDYLNIDFENFGDLDIQLHHVNGTLIQKINKANTDISELPAGLYFVLIQSKTSGQSVTAKIVKQ